MSKSLASLARKRTLRVAGLMSGTSADGIDVAIVDFAARKVDVLAAGCIAYPPAARAAIFRLFAPATSRVDDICHMNFVLGELFADALARVAAGAGIALRTIDLVGSHGQTIYHQPAPRCTGGVSTASTLQIGEPSIIAERTGIAVVADFRPRDMAAGGQGAPLVPYADWLLLTHRRLGRAVQNIGGIANVTYLRPGCGIGEVLAFDTGPGNMMIDRAAWHATGGRRSYDKDGLLAAAGKVNHRLLAELMRNPYLRRRPPKSTGRELFGVAATDALVKRHGAGPDVLATLTAFTARSIAQAYARLLRGPVDEAIICGGGARNGVLLAMLRDELATAMRRPPAVRIIDELGITADAKEAVSFAILAAQTIRGRCGNVPRATGAKGPVVLGKIVP